MPRLIEAPERRDTETLSKGRPQTSESDVLAPTLMALQRAVTELQRKIRERQFEAEYQVLSLWYGGRMSREEQAQHRRLWLSSGADAADWLVRRIRNETDLESLSNVANLLGELGLAGLQASLRELNRSTTPEHTAILLKAIGWLAKDHGPIASEDLQPRVASLLRSRDPEVREAAAQATRALDRNNAVALLRDALAHERDEDVRLALVEEIEECEGR